MSLTNLNGSFEKVEEVEVEEVEMRIIKREKNNMLVGKEKAEINSSKRDSFVSIKHYDQLLNDLRCPGKFKSFKDYIHTLKNDFHRMYCTISNSNLFV